MTDQRMGRRIELLGRLVIAGGLAGAVAGFIWGGIGGRLAMRIIFLTSNSPVDGLQSDDGFQIGRFSGDTVFLVSITTIIGAFIGPLAALVRRALRNRTAVAAAAFAVAMGAFVGSAIVHSDGIDFRLLDPLPLTVGLFILIPAAAGATGVLLVDRLLRPNSWVMRLPRPLAMAAVLLGAVPVVMTAGSVVLNVFALAVVVTSGLIGWGIAAIAASRTTGSRLTQSTHWAAWVLLTLATAYGVVGLAQDIAALR